MKREWMKRKMTGERLGGKKTEYDEGRWRWDSGEEKNGVKTERERQGERIAKVRCKTLL